MYRVSIMDFTFHQQQADQMSWKILVIIVLVFSSLVLGQPLDLEENAVYMPEAKVENYTKVNSKGDLGFSIPLIQIPGRGGIDFNLSLSYTPGIRTESNASWVGWGWDLPIGSISRIPSGQNQDRFCDFTDVYPMHSDIYVVSFPAGSNSMFAIKDANSNTQFVFQEYNNWKVEYETADPVTVEGAITKRQNGNYYASLEDFQKFIIITSDGTKYIFGKPLLGLSELIAQSDNSIIRYEIYVNTWLLTAIESFDYSDANQNGQYDNDDDGSWVSIQYEYDSNDEIYSLYSEALDARILMQQTYPKKIETPTHFVEFNTASRDKEIPYYVKEYLISDHYKRLDNIKLFSKIKDENNPEFIEGWQFEHGMYNGSNNFTLMPGTNVGKLTLNRFYRFNDAYNMPAFELEYHQDNITPVPNHGTCWTSNTSDWDQQKIDLWGFFKPSLNANSIAKAWSIKSILFPSGLEIEYDWETDYIGTADGTYSSTWKDWVFNWSQGDFTDTYSTFPNSQESRTQGGIRVKTIEIREGNNLLRKHRYEYEPGRLTGIPNRYIYASNRMPDPTHTINYVSSDDYGQCSIIYPKITEMIEDQNSGLLAKTEYHYTTDLTDANKYLGNQSVAVVYFYFGSNLRGFLLKDNRTFNWGRLIKKIDFDALGNSKREIQNTYSDQLMHQAYQIAGYGTQDNLMRKSYLTTMTSTTEDLIDDADNRFSIGQDLTYDFEQLAVKSTRAETSSGTVREKRTHYQNIPIGRFMEIQNGNFDESPGYSQTGKLSLEPLASANIPGWQLTSTDPENAFKLEMEWAFISELDAFVNLYAGSGQGTIIPGSGDVFFDTGQLSIVGDRNYKLSIVAELETKATYEEGTPTAPANPQSRTFADAYLKVKIYYYQDSQELSSAQIFASNSSSSILIDESELNTSNITRSQSVNATIDFTPIVNCNNIKIQAELYTYGNEIEVNLEDKWKSLSKVTLKDIQLYLGDINASPGTIPYVLAEENRLNLVASEEVFEDDGQTTSLRAKTQYLYADFDPGSESQIRLSEAQSWEDSNFDNTVDTGEWITTNKVVLYDDHGNVLTSENARGIQSAVKYEHANSVIAGTATNCSANELLIELCESFRDVSGYGNLASQFNLYHNGNGSLYYAPTSDAKGSSAQLVTIQNLTSQGAGVNLNLGSLDGSKDFVIEFDYKVSEGVLEILSDAAGYNYRTEASFMVDPEWKHARLIWDLGTTTLDGNNSQLWFRAPWNGAGSPNTTFYLDNIRVYPENAQVVSQTYDTGKRQLTAYSDVSGSSIEILSDKMGLRRKAINIEGIPLITSDYFQSREISANNLYDPVNPNYSFQAKAQSDGFFDSFNGSELADWQVAVSHSSMNWAAVDDNLECAYVGGSPGYSYLVHSSLDVSESDLLIEYDVNFANTNQSAGIWYRGVFCEIGPAQCGWLDLDQNFFTSGIGTDQWHNIKLLIKKDGINWVSTLFVDGKKKFVNENIDMPNFPRTDIGFVGHNDYGKVKFNDVAVLLNPIIKMNFYNPLAQNIQSLIEQNSDDLITASVFDELGRKVQEYKPYTQESQFAYDASFATNANTYYSSLGPGADALGKPYVQTDYAQDLLNQLNSVRRPGTTGGHNNPTTYTYRVNTAADAVAGYTAGTLWVNEKQDPDGKTTRAFSDKDGKTVLQRALTSSGNVDTRFEYDIQGNLEKSIDPTGLEMEYLSDSRGQVVASTMPDLDGDGDSNPVDENIDHSQPLLSTADIRYKYNLHGKLRFQQNPILKSQNRVQYFVYDEFDRKIAEGSGDLGGLTWENLDSKIENQYAFESSPDIQYFYDAASAYHPEAANLAGSLSWVEFKYLYGTKTGRRFYSYTESGLVEWVIDAYDGLSEKKTLYLYSKASVVQQQSFYDMGSLEEYHLWFDYDGQGRLSAVFHHNINNKPALASVRYAYWPFGKVKTAFLGEQASGAFAQTVDYEYNPQDWLSRINEGSVENTPGVGDKFALILNYYGGTPAYPLYGGDITYLNAIYSDELITVDEQPVDYFYDDLHRLTNANQAGQDDLIYNYSASGNLLSKKVGSTTYTYTYGNSNRLQSYGSTTFAHDLNGNISRKTLSPGNYSDYVFNFRNQLDAVLPNSTSISNDYGYDETGNRIVAIATDNVEEQNGYYYFYDNSQRLIAVYDLSDNPVYFNIIGNDVVGKASYNY